MMDRGTKIDFDNLIIKVMHNAWERAYRDGDTWLTTTEVARAIKLSKVSTLKRLKKLQSVDDTLSVKGVFRGQTWLWRYNNKVSGSEKQ